MKGKPINYPVSEPLVFELDPDYVGELKPMYESKILVMRNDLVETLKEIGIDNIQCYHATLRDPVTKKEHTDYWAVNIIGIVSCADMEKSKLMGTSDSTLIDVDFHSLVIDEAKTGGAMLFRLAESVSAIIVHEKIKGHIQKRKIAGMTFYGPGEWSG